MNMTRDICRTFEILILLSGLARKITSLIPDYMVMGERGMSDMAEMQMPLPGNSIPMMTGRGPFGSVEMGGMLSVVKVRKHSHGGHK